MEREPGEKSLQKLTTIPWTPTKTCNGRSVTRKKKAPVGRENKQALEKYSTYLFLMPATLLENQNTV